jgi:hypothetical protein
MMATQLTVAVDIGNNVMRAQVAVFTSVDTLAQANFLEEYIACDPMLEGEKTNVLGRLQEIKLVLDWFVNTRRLLASLPLEKYAAWTSDLETALAFKGTNKKSLEKLLSRLSHAATVIPLACFYLGHFYFKLNLFDSDFKSISWNKSDLKYLRILVALLKQALMGILLNLMTFRRPTNIVLSDARLDGIDGFSISTGKAWRLRLPPDHNLHINSLEWMSCMATVWLEHLNGAVPHLGNNLALSDNTSCVGWLHKCNFYKETHPVQAAIAFQLADCCMSHSTTLRSQHIKGKKNVVADALSCRHDLSALQLTNFVLTITSHRFWHTFTSVLFRQR